MSRWRTTVGELMQIFRDALVALVPALDRARIGWRSPDASDNWDAIVQVLFDNIVVSALQWSLPLKQQERFAVPKYETTHRFYGYRNFIQVIVDDDRRLVFHSFDSQKDLFDTVRCLLLDENGAVISPEPVSVPFESAAFALRLLGGIALTDLEVAL
jgi:hypothetical protein